jgi:hypothetical protein
MGIYEDLLIPGTHKWEGVANGINRMAHHHKITEQIVGGQHLVPLGLLDLAVFLGATGDCMVANQVMPGLMFHRCTKSSQVVMWYMLHTRSGSLVPQ